MSVLPEAMVTVTVPAVLMLTLNSVKLPVMVRLLTKMAVDVPALIVPAVYVRLAEKEIFPRRVSVPLDLLIFMMGRRDWPAITAVPSMDSAAVPIILIVADPPPPEAVLVNTIFPLTLMLPVLMVVFPAPLILRFPVAVSVVPAAILAVRPELFTLNSMLFKDRLPVAVYVPTLPCVKQKVDVPALTMPAV